MMVRPSLDCQADRHRYSRARSRNKTMQQRSSMTSGHKAIAVLAPQLSGDYFGTLFAGIRSVIDQHQVRLIAIQGTPREIFASRLAWDQVDGWIIINDADGLDQTTLPGLPLVTLGVQVPGVDCPAVFPNNYAG